MGLWAKVKGVFGRIGGGIKQGDNWIKDHLSTIKDVADKAKELIPEQYKDKYTDVIDKGYDTANKVIRKFG